MPVGSNVGALYHKLQTQSSASEDGRNYRPKHVELIEIINKIIITSIYQPTNAHIISHKTNLKHFETLRHVSILSDHHQGALFLAKVILQYSQFNSYLQTRCCGCITCCVGMCCGAVARCASYDAHLATAPQHNMICCHNTSFVNTN